MNITVKYLVEAQKYIALMPEKAREKCSTISLWLRWG